MKTIPQHGTLERALGTPLYLVGGAVRDLMRGQTPKDYDFACALHPEAMMTQLQENGFNVYPTGIEHGTISVMVEDTLYEITTFRGDGEYSDGRRPDSVQYVNDLETDLARRDFTINAMALSSDGTLIDPFRGEHDLHHRIIRCVGSPIERFNEDGLRPIRAARFASTLGFCIEGATQEAMRQTDTYKQIAPERFCDELRKALLGDAPYTFVDLLDWFGIWNHFVPEFGPMFSMPQPVKHHKYDVKMHCFVALKHATDLTADPIVRLSALLHDIGKPATYNGDPNEPHFYGHEKVGATIVEERLRALRGFSAAEIKRVRSMVEHHMLQYEPTWTDKQVRRWLAKVGSMDAARDVITVRMADSYAHGTSVGRERANNLYGLLDRLEALKNPPMTVKDLAVDGHDLMRLGLKGKEVGTALKHLLDAVLDEPELNNRESLLHMAQHNC